MNIFSEINLWESVGPLIITIVILLIVGVTLAIIVNRMERGITKNIIVKIMPVFLVVFLIGAITFLSGVWGSR